MPLDFGPAEGDEPSYPGVTRFSRPRTPWWRPASTVARVFLGLGVLAVLAGLVVSVDLLKSYLARDGRFRIEGAGNIEASGLTQVSRAELLPVFGEDVGRNIFFVPLGERRRQLEQIPWVEHATVMRLLPDQIRVELVERQPVAFARQGHDFGLVDANGVLLSMPAAAMAKHHYSFPTITGIDAGDSLTARRTRMAVYLRLLGELDGNGQKLSEQISEIDLTDQEDARVTMQDDTTLLHFGNERFLERYERYKAHIAEWRQQYPKLTAVDLRYEQQVVLEMAHGANVAEAAAAGQDAGGAGADAAPDKPKAGGAAVKPGAKAAGGKAAAPKSSTKAGQGKAGNKAGVKTAAKPKTAKEKAQEKKRAEAQRAALNGNKRKAAPTGKPAAVAAEGQ